MAIFKEVVRGDGSGIAEYYRINDGKVMNVDYSVVTNKPTINGVVLAGDLTLTDFGADGVVETMTGEEIAQLGGNANTIVLCTSDYLYTDRQGVLTQTERGTIYEIAYGTIVDKISVSGSGSGGGGGGVPRSNFTTTVSELDQKVSVKSDVVLQYRFVTTAMPNTGTAKLYVNSVLKSTKSITSGSVYEFNVTPYLKSGTNYFTIKTIDEYGAEKSLEYIINAIELGITSTFTGKSVYDINFDYVYTLTGAGEKTMHFIVDGEEFTETNSTMNVAQIKKFENFTHGQHTLEVFSTLDLDGETLTSNVLTYTFLTADPTSDVSLIMSEFNTATATEGDLLTIDYLVYNPKKPKMNVELQINGVTQINVEVDRNKKYWNVSNYPVGTVTFSIVAGDVRIDKVVEVAELDIDLNPVEDSMLLYLTAANRSNQELDETRDVWEYENVQAELNNFNWVSDGWIDGTLKFKGASNGFIPLQLFADDARVTGKTIEFEFITHRAFKEGNLLLSCFAERKGFEIYQNYCTLSSEQTSITAKYGEESSIRVSFVIESAATNRLMKVYINGILSGLTQYSETDNFQHNSPVGITINPNGEEFDIKSIRVYSRELSSQEILHNYMYDMTDNAMKIQTYTNNLIFDDYGNVSYVKMKAQMPVLTITGTLPTSKGDKQTVYCLYENIADEAYDFEYDGCVIDVQGTSSQYYPRKNWKITLPEKIKFHEDAIEEDTFCFKADYMETSHSHNIGTAILANSLPKELFPTRQEDPKVRDTMYGFPCVIFHKETEESTPVFYGTFMFNNDKSNNATLGLTTEKSESWEFKNNTSDHCLFKTNDFTAAAKPEDNLEARYPDKNTDYTNIKKLYDWVVSCKNDVAKFKAEFNQHLNLEYCLNYQVLMEFAMLTDSRAKNMFLDTVDGEIWYPRFYDMDTCWGLNNEGWLTFGYDVEIHDRTDSGYVWNDRGESVLWNLFEEAFADEIKEKYAELRKDYLTYDNLLEIYVTNIADKFTESAYNEDAYFKYILPLIETKDSTYLYAAQGDRREHFKYLLNRRILYLDSKYEYGDYNTSYATMRLYCNSAMFTLTPYNTGYLKVKFGSSIVSAKGEAGVPVTIISPAGLEFNDTETIIYGATGLANLGDLSAMYPGTVDVTRCGKLQELIVGPAKGVNANLKTLSLGSNPLLRKLDVQNCPNLTGNLDMTGCTDLREVYLTGSGVTSISLPDTSSVQTLYLPSSLTSLTLKNQKSLTKLVFESFSNIQTLILNNSYLGMSVDELVFSCPNLQRLNIECGPGFLEEMTLDQLLYYTNNLNGVGEDGYNTEYPGFTGSLTVSIGAHYTEEERASYQEFMKQAYPLLDITYVDGPALYTFYGYKEDMNGSSPILRYTNVEDDIICYGISLNGSVAPAVVTIPSSYKNKPIIGFSSTTSYIYLNQTLTAYISNSNDLVSFIDNNDYESLDINVKYNLKSGVSFAKCPKLKSVNCKASYLNVDCWSSNTPLSLYEDINRITQVGYLRLPDVKDNLDTLWYFPNLEIIPGNFGNGDEFGDVNWEKLKEKNNYSSRLGLNRNYGDYDDYLQHIATEAYSNINTYGKPIVKITKHKPQTSNEIENKAIEYFNSPSSSYSPLYNLYFKNTGDYEYLYVEARGLFGDMIYYGDVAVKRIKDHLYNVTNIIADSFTGLETIGETTFISPNKTKGEITCLTGIPTLYHTDMYKPLVLPAITDLRFDMSLCADCGGNSESWYTLSGGPILSFPNLKSMYSNSLSRKKPISVFSFDEEDDKTPDKRFWKFLNETDKILIPDNVVVYDESKTTTGFQYGLTKISPFIGELLGLASSKTLMHFPLFDCSQMTRMHLTYASNLATITSPVTFKGFKDYGKSFDPTAAANYSEYTLGTFRQFRSVDLQSLINILDNLYDIASLGCATQTVELYTTHLNTLNASEEGIAAIERATAKGWTII